MNPDECVKLCQQIHAAVPHQQWATGTPDVWFDLGLSQIAYDDAWAAVCTMVRARTFIDFQGIVDGVRKLRNERAQGADRIDPPPAEELDPDDWRAFQAWQRRTTTAVASGDLAPPPDVRQEIPARVLAALPGVGRRVPRRPR